MYSLFSIISCYCKIFKISSLFIIKMEMIIVKIYENNY